jgi:hypothetical protein
MYCPALSLFTGLAPGPPGTSRIFACGFRSPATLAQALLETLRKATDRLGISWHELLCAGLSEPYLILEPHEHGAFGLQLPLAALLAELTGISMAHAFGLRDFAAGGQGMPVVATADWILFHSPAEDRVVVHLGDIFWMHWLPRNGSWQQMRGSVVGPGLAWLTALAWALNFGRESSDRLGHLAVQGRVRHDLMARWQSHPALLRRNTRGISLSAFGYEWTQSTVQLARQRGWPGFDILCTAHHWLAILVADTLKQLVQDTVRVSLLPDTGNATGSYGDCWRKNLSACVWSVPTFMACPPKQLKQYGRPFWLVSCSIRNLQACRILPEAAGRECLVNGLPARSPTGRDVCSG